MPEFLQAFSDSGDVSQISAGQNQVIRDSPVPLFEDFEEDGLLAFETEGIEGIDEVETEFVRKFAKHPECLIEVVAHLDDHGAKFKGLSQLGGGDFSKGNKDHGFHSGTRSIGRHRSGGIASRGACGHAAAENRSLSDAGGHAQIFE